LGCGKRRVSDDIWVEEEGIQETATADGGLADFD
jgi:hypothetical protein